MTQDDAKLDGMTARLTAWRRQHPHATFAEMERAVEEEVSRMRATLLQEIASERDEAITLCPRCGRRMWRRGEHTRDLEIPGGVPIQLSRTYQTCPHCQLGLFPPGPGT